MAIIMLFIALALLGVGIPVAFVFGGAALAAALLSPEIGLEVFNVLPFRIYGIMSNSTLMAVPLFILMGLLLERSGTAEKLLIAMTSMFGTLKGGLAVSVVLVGAILAATMGIVSASVVMMSLIALPLMIRAGYSKELSSGTIAASGTLGQIIPPSVILIILGDVMNISVGDLFAGAMLPGLLLVALYIIYIVVIAHLKPHMAPPLRDEDHHGSFVSLVWAITPMLLLMIIVLGSIFSGIASPSESAAFGVIGALIISLLNKTLTRTMLRQSLRETLKLSGMIFMILIGATAFSLVFNELGGTDQIIEFFGNNVSSAWMFIFIAMLVIFILGFFIDFIEISFIIVPILLPVMHAYGIDPLWFAILIAMNLQTSFLTPPFGLSLFFVKGAAGDSVTSGQIYRGIIPFVLLQIVALALVMSFPNLVFSFV
ncbi:TRAP transporter large permease subunit [Sulfuricurvum sp.]|uniref:TRAP transporter large permease n=1 Tax=Sulfuricurvum sp. TaxID=2025608 RepID=UPI00343E6E63